MPSSGAIRAMFRQVAPRYDLLNRVLSVGIDRRWRKACVRYAEARSGERALDLAAGTGDLALELATAAGCRVVGADFVHGMLTRAKAKASKRGATAVHWVEADGQQLPFPDQTFDLVTIGFGLRNFEDPLRGLEEMHRVLEPGGRVVVLEFAKPRVPVFGPLYGWYFRTVLPRLGRLLSPGSGDAYQYLPDSVQAFPEREELLAVFAKAGFARTRYRLLSGGIAAMYRGDAGEESGGGSG
jgi:demethylmenaquinone methyltransferase/2-methoxy-6-polyprenyl-1,4-benzoquinol methylase